MTAAYAEAELQLVFDRPAPGDVTTRAQTASRVLSRPGGPT